MHDFPVGSTILKEVEKAGSRKGGLRQAPRFHGTCRSLGFGRRRLGRAEAARVWFEGEPVALESSSAISSQVRQGGMTDGPATKGIRT